MGIERIISVVTFTIFAVPVAAFLVLSDTERRQAISTPVDQLPGRVVMYHTPSCGACKFMTPVVSQVSAAGYPIESVDIRQHPDVGRELRIRAVPTFVYYKNGKEVFRRTGCISQNKLEDMCRGIR